MTNDSLLRRIESKRDEVIELTQALVRIPTVNPPGDAYEACARLLGERGLRQGKPRSRRRGNPRGPLPSHPHAPSLVRLHEPRQS